MERSSFFVTFRRMKHVSPTGLQRLTRRAVLVGTLTAMAQPAAAATPSDLALVMVDDPNCRYCRAFDADIGGGYARTAQGRIAPLARIQRKSVQLKSYNPVIYTPTFLLVRGGQELGRITGYPGPDYFYAELDTLLNAAGYAPGLQSPASPSKNRAT
jgi:hypothetical protein